MTAPWRVCRTIAALALAVSLPGCEGWDEQSDADPAGTPGPRTVRTAGPDPAVARPGDTLAAGDVTWRVTGATRSDRVADKQASDGTWVIVNVELRTDRPRARVALDDPLPWAEDADLFSDGPFLSEELTALLSGARHSLFVPTEVTVRADRPRIVRLVMRVTGRTSGLELQIPEPGLDVEDRSGILQVPAPRPVGEIPPPR